MDPRRASLDDLAKDITNWQLLGDVIILGMDAKKDTRSRNLKTYFDNLQMKNAVLDRHKHLSPPATHTRNKKREPIDGIWVSKSLDPVAAGFLAVSSAFPSDHVALWVDFRREDLLGTRVGPTQHSINHMKADDPRLVNKYNKLSLKVLKPARVKEQLQAL